jgi:hypothetical protein
MSTMQQWPVSGLEPRMNLDIGGRPCSEMSQAELFRAMRFLVPGIDATMGHGELMQRMSMHYARISEEGENCVRRNA